MPIAINDLLEASLGSRLQRASARARADRYAGGRHASRIPCFTLRGNDIVGTYACCLISIIPVKARIQLTGELDTPITAIGLLEASLRFLPAACIGRCPRRSLHVRLACQPNSLLHSAPERRCWYATVTAIHHRSFPRRRESRTCRKTDTPIAHHLLRHPKIPPRRANVVATRTSPPVDDRGLNKENCRLVTARPTGAAVRPMHEQNPI